ncbi:tetratricopeptide repeat protein [Pedobacter agri]|uniref:tetratricopeptide repeat protein n=1 Tax=Pedobacter agri TaxID=454586 RepID=UPI00292FC9AC|nr:tetratricopeptide repeat protein [Pedobacter agri]
MEQTKQPLRGKKLLIFGILFGVFMILVGYLIFRSSESSSLTAINRDLKMKRAEEIFDKGLIFYDQKNYVQASQYFAESLDGGFQIAHALLGECQLHLGNYDKAERNLLAALEVTDGEAFLKGYYSGVEYNLGAVYYHLGKISFSRQHLINAKKLGNPDADSFLKKLPAH